MQGPRAAVNDSLIHDRAGFAQSTEGNLRLRLFGHFAADDPQGRPYLPRTRKTRAILAILALGAPKPVLRLQLVSLLWSRRGKEQGRSSLRQAIHELQDTLGFRFGHLLTIDRNFLALRDEGMSVDVLNALRFDAANPEAILRFQTPILDDLGGLDPAFDVWIQDERARIKRLALSIGEGILLTRVDPDDQISTANHILSVDRGHEAAWRAIIRAETTRGNIAEAIAAYEQCCLALAGAEQGRPSAETEELIDRVRTVPSPPPRVAPPVVEPAPAGGGTTVRGRLRLGVAMPRTIGVGAIDDLAAGVAEEVVTGLSRFRWISCIPVEATDAALGTRSAAGGTPDYDFLLDSTLQQSTGQVRLMARLHDMRQGGGVAWARRFDHPITDTWTLQESLAATLVAQIDPELLIQEAERSAAANHPDPTAHDYVLRAIPAIYRLELSGFEAAGLLLEAAVAAEPLNSVAHAWYAYWYLFLLGQGWATDPQQNAVRAVQLAERAVTLDPGDARALTLAGHVRGFVGRKPSEATVLHDRALTMNPNLALAWCFSGLSHAYLGNLDEAEHRMTRAMRLSPSDPHMFFFDSALTMPFLLRGDYAQAAAIGRRAIELNPGFSSTYKGQLAALGHLGNREEAREVKARLLAIEPRFTVNVAIQRSPFQRPADLEHYAQGLRLGGLPED